MGFKDSLQEDLNDVFFNDDEFACIHTIDGKEMPIIIDEDGLEEMKKLREGDYDGIYKAKLLFFVQKKHFGSKPAIDSIIELDNKLYQVKNATEDGVMLKIILGWDED